MTPTLMHAADFSCNEDHAAPIRPEILRVAYHDERKPIASIRQLVDELLSRDTRPCEPVPCRFVSGTQS